MCVGERKRGAQDYDVPVRSGLEVSIAKDGGEDGEDFIRG